MQWVGVRYFLFILW